jgi:hypothetical protein
VTATAQQRLAGTDLAGKLYEAFAAFDCNQQSIQRFLVGGAGEYEACVGSDAERGFAQTKIGTVHISVTSEY